MPKNNFVKFPAFQVIMHVLFIEKMLKNMSSNSLYGHVWNPFYGICHPCTPKWHVQKIVKYCILNQYRPPCGQAGTTSSQWRQDFGGESKGMPRKITFSTAVMVPPRCFCRQGARKLCSASVVHCGNAGKMEKWLSEHVVSMTFIPIPISIEW